MPQSIHFDKTDTLIETREIINGLSHYTLLVRDLNSLTFAEREFKCTAALCPDAALALAPLTAPSPGLDVFALLRSDKEASADHKAIRSLLDSHGYRWAEGDWVAKGFSTQTLPARYLSNLRARYPRAAPALRRLHAAAVVNSAEIRLRKGIDLVSQGEVIITDRLHGQLIAAMCQRPVIVLDSYDGKISAFFSAYSHRIPNIHLVQSLTDLSSVLETLLPDSPTTPVSQS